MELHIWHSLSPTGVLVIASAKRDFPYILLAISHSIYTHMFNSQTTHVKHMEYTYACTHVRMHVCTAYYCTHTKFLFQTVNIQLRNFCIYSIASKSTSQVRGWQPLPPTHLVRPACTAVSTFLGLVLKHTSVLCTSNPTPSRTARPMPGALLFTYALKSMAWFGWLQRGQYCSQPISIEVIGITTFTIHCLWQDVTLPKITSLCLLWQ